MYLQLLVDGQADKGSEEEREDRVAREVQLLMDCVADMIVHEGMEGMLKMVNSGLSLYPEISPRCVRGNLPDHMGGGESICSAL